MNKTLMALGIALAIAPAAHAAKFECAFEQEKFQSGKANDTTCTMTPEVVFQRENNPSPARSVQCEARKVVGYHDLRNFVVDTALNTASWDEYSGMVEASIPSYTRYLISKGKSQENAEREARAVTSKHEEYVLVNSYTGKNSLYWDENTKKPYAKPKVVSEHYLTLRNGFGSTMQLYIPESSGHAILTQYDSYEQGSWVNMRFGQCRKTY